MKSLAAVIVIVVIVNSLHVGALHSNSFDVIRGCKQYNAVLGYDGPVTYFPTSEFLHVGLQAESKFFKIAIQGPSDGHIRFGESLFPYDKDVIELVFVVEVFNNGTVQVSIDGQVHPFLSFNDEARIPVNYMAFAKWDRDLVYFYDSIKGCIQFDDALGYNETPRYLATNTFRNVGRTSNSRYFRIGVVGKNDGHIRYGRSAYPFNENVIELVLSGWSNTQTVARRQFRNRNQTHNNVLLKELATPGLLHRARPMVFRLEVFDNGLVQLTKDGEPKPFFQFSDTLHAIPADYIAFVKFDVDMIYFYDCPLNVEPSATIGGEDSVLLRCSIA
uniref:Farnesoic acid O-methyl transferase domain-containing protein n=1 Tax=Anopheles farauti TaxID=69004 RepID=A0A182QKH6_9DIPT